MQTTDTIAAVATAPGRSGIGIVRVSGPDVRRILTQITAKPVLARRAVLTEFLDPEGAAIDSGIALFFPAPASYTGEDVLELQGHGGPVVLRMLLERCVALGARVAEPGEFTRRAFLNGKLDLAQAEAVIDVIEAATASAAKSAMRSLSGEFSAEIHGLAESLQDLRVLVEATLDFPEEEIEEVHREDAARRLAGVRRNLDRTLGAAKQGSLLRDGVNIVLAGQPNVGKSSLLNRLAGQDLAIVTEVPGTTRDTIREVIDIGGIPAHIIDTAGLRDPQDPVEQMGVARTWAAVEKADLVLWVVDVTADASERDLELIRRLPAGIPKLRLMNKIDLVGRAPDIDSRAEDTTVWLSAKTGDGVAGLREILLERLGWRGSGEGVFLARARHLEALHATRSHLLQAEHRLAQADLFAEELRLAQDALGIILGRSTPDDLLGEIFSRFCIGK
jgi:tRNA modification GTPase